MSDDRLATFKRVLAVTAHGRKWTDEAAAELIGMVDEARDDMGDLHDSVALLKQQRDQARRDAVALADECAGIDDQDSPCGVPIYDRIAEYREAMKRETPPDR